MEVITTRHFIISAPLVLVVTLITRSVFMFLADDFIAIYNAIGYLGFFFLINLPAAGLQFIENKFLWGRILSLKDNLSFFGVSVGFGIGLFSLGKW